MEIFINPKTAMQQYHDFKEKHPNHLLLFRAGDSYKAYEDDAHTLEKVLGIGIYNQHTPEKWLHVAEFPHHALDTYLPRLIRAGYKVGITDVS